MEKDLSEFEKELESLINKHNIDVWTGTPDYILAGLLMRELKNWREALSQREQHFNAVGL